MDGASSIQSADLSWLDKPDVFRVNRLDAHSDHRCYATQDEAERDSSGLIMPLDGTWKFKYSPNPQARPVGFHQLAEAPADFDDIAVPGHIEMAGYDKNQYINTMYPWEGRKYRRPAGLTPDDPGIGTFSDADDNPVGSYMRTFSLPEHMRGQRIHVVFEGVEQAFYLWLNGHFVGYAEDTFTPSEFDLTPYINETGANTIACEVFKRSTAAWVEDQDFFRFFGIFRPVKLVALPKIHVDDIAVRSLLSDDLQTGTITVDMRLSAKDAADFAGAQAEVVVTDPQGTRIASQTSSPETDGDATLAFTGIAAPQLWDNGSPNLYCVDVRLIDASGKTCEIAQVDTGFRKLVRDGVKVTLNGHRLYILGVNRHEWNADSGRCITMDDMHRDIDTMLRNNINAVRTCHYPDRLEWYRLCDEHGIYVMAETNLESHGTWQKMGIVEPSYNVPGNSSVWEKVVVDRATTQYEMLKNHPSILFWSMGNESYAGTAIAAMDAYYKSKQDGRLTHYEGVVHNRAFEDVISDLESRMYDTPEGARKYLSEQPKKPYILCEFMHDMGNSLGGFGDYMELFDDCEGFLGGFIWDYIDQQLYAPDPLTGEKMLCYGGDFDDRCSDYEFSGDGLLFADRTEKPAMQEVKYYYGRYADGNRIR